MEEGRTCSPDVRKPSRFFIIPRRAATGAAEFLSLESIGHQRPVGRPSSAPLRFLPCRSEWCESKDVKVREVVRSSPQVTDRYNADDVGAGCDVWRSTRPGVLAYYTWGARAVRARTTKPARLAMARYTCWQAGLPHVRARDVQFPSALFFLYFDPLPI